MKKHIAKPATLNDVLKAYGITKKEYENMKKLALKLRKKK